MGVPGDLGPALLMTRLEVKQALLHPWASSSSSEISHLDKVNSEISAR